MLDTFVVGGEKLLDKINLKGVEHRAKSMNHLLFKRAQVEGETDGFNYKRNWC